MAAPQCTHPGCKNRTWNPDGLCHLHVASSLDVENISIPDTPEGVMTASPDSGYSTGIYEQARSVFPDIDNQVHPSSVRRQVVIALRSAVSIEAYRRFPQTDVVDSHERQEALKQQHYEVVELGHITSADIDDDTAINMSYSSEDSYGRSYRDSVSIASWGAAKEWELAKSMGIEADDHGIEYGDDKQQYIEQVSKHLDNQVSDEFMRQLARYPRIIEEVNGRKPLSDEPVIPGGTIRFPDLPKSETIRIRRHEPEQPQEHPTSDFREGLTSVAKSGASKLLSAIGNSIERQRARETANSMAFAQAKEARRERKIRREEEEIRKLHLQELRYNRRQRRKLF